MEEFILSFCIPTHNFGSFIGETLASLVPQMNEEMEIVIVDGASTDFTEEIVRSFQESYPNIRYFKQNKRGGIDHDMALSVSLARGKYCWLFSADDVMRRGAVERFICKMEEGVDVYLTGFTQCGLDVYKGGEYFKFTQFESDTSFLLSNEEEREWYFQNAITTTAFFSFMSSIIVRKESWNRARGSEEFYGTYWAHAFRLFSLILEGEPLKLKLIPESHFYRRGENESILEHGIVDRLGIAIEGYSKMGGALFGHNSEEAFHMRRAVRNELSLSCLLLAKLEIQTKKEEKKFRGLVFKHYSDQKVHYYCFLLLYHALHPNFLIIMRKVKRIIKKMKYYSDLYPKAHIISLFYTQIKKRSRFSTRKFSWIKYQILKASGKSNESI